MVMRTVLGHDVWTFDMATGNYNNIYTEIESDWHDDGSSDDLMWHSGVRNINLDNAEEQQDSNGIIRTVSPDNFMWEFVIQYKTAPYYDSNQYPDE